MLFDVFGDDIKNAGVTDGWSAYKIFPILQTMLGTTPYYEESVLSITSSTTKSESVVME